MICPECKEDKKKSCMIYDCDYVGCDAVMCDPKCSIRHREAHERNKLRHEVNTWYDRNFGHSPEYILANTPDVKAKHDEHLRFYFDWNQAFSLKYIDRFFMFHSNYCETCKQCQ